MSNALPDRKLVLLTGASGFVGRHLLRELASRNLEIRLVLRSGSEVERSAKIESIVRSDDIFEESAAWWKSACADVDTVIHAAWYVDPKDYLRSPKNLDCLRGTLSLAQGAVDASVRRLIGIGTCFEYRQSDADLSIDSPLDPRTPYAAAKAAAYLALSQYFASAKLEFLWCRLFYLFGEGEDERRLVPYVRRQVSRGQVAQLSSGNQIRDFLDVREAAGKIISSAMTPQTGALNICSGQPVSVQEIAEKVADEFGRRDLLSFDANRDRAGDPMRVVGSSGNQA